MPRQQRRRRRSTAYTLHPETKTLSLFLSLSRTHTDTQRTWSQPASGDKKEADAADDDGDVAPIGGAERVWKWREAKKVFEARRRRMTSAVRYFATGQACQKRTHNVG